MSLDDVRARTSASRSQLYHYFEDRDDLVHAVIDVTIDAVLDTQGELLAHLDSWANIDRWFDSLVQHQIGRQACGGCPIGSLAGQLAESDPHARAAIAGGLARWEARLRDGLTRMRTRGKLRKDADPAALATATMASIQGGLLLTQVRRDPLPAPHRAQRSAQQPPRRGRLITAAKHIRHGAFLEPSGHNRW